MCYCCKKGGKRDERREKYSNKIFRIKTKENHRPSNSTTGVILIFTFHNSSISTLPTFQDAVAFQITWAEWC